MRVTSRSSPAADSERPLRVAVLGARTVVQGLGPWVARSFRDAGCEVVGLLGTRHESVAAARDDLRRRFGIEARGYTRLAELLASERPEIVALCTPWASHRALLAELAAADVHVLCEKPLFWDPACTRRPRQALIDETAALISGFVTGGRLLALNAQWPFVLDAYRALLPEACAAPLTRVALRLAPVSVGGEQVVDAAPHLLSVLSALLGRGGIADIVATPRPPDGWALSFRYAPHPTGPHETGPHAAGPHATGPASAAAGSARAGRTPADSTQSARPPAPVQVELLLSRCAQQPRPAALALNGVWASREVTLPEYRMELVGGHPPQPGARRVPLPDPLALLVADFVAGVRAGRQTDSHDLVESQGHLRDLVAAAEAAGATRSPESA